MPIDQLNLPSLGYVAGQRSEGQAQAAGSLDVNDHRLVAQPSGKDQASAAERLNLDSRRAAFQPSDAGRTPTVEQHDVVCRRPTCQLVNEDQPSSSKRRQSRHGTADDLCAD